MAMKEKLQRTNLTHLPIVKRSVPARVPLNDETLLEEIKQLVEQGFVDSVTYYGIEYGMVASYAVAYKKRTKTLIIQLMNFFIAG